MLQNRCWLWILLGELATLSQALYWATEGKDEVGAQEARGEEERGSGNEG